MKSQIMIAVGAFAFSAVAQLENLPACGVSFLSGPLAGYSPSHALSVVFWRLNASIYLLAERVDVELSSVYQRNKRITTDLSLANLH